MDVLRQGAGLARRHDVDRRNALLGVEATAQRAATVDHHAEVLVVGHPRVEAIDWLCPAQLCDLVDHLGFLAPAYDVDDLVALLVWGDGQGTAVAAGPFGDGDRTELRHERAPPLTG